MLDLETLESRDLLSPYAVIDLGASFGATALNQEGQVVGAVDGRPSLWDRGHVYDLGGLSVAPLAVNDWGFAAGGSGRAFGHAYYWDDQGQVDLGVLGGQQAQYASASGLNNWGEVVGFSTVDEDNSMHIAIWRPHRPPADMGFGAATAVNDAGQVTGFHNNAQGHIGAFRMEPDGTVEDLPFPTTQGYGSFGNAIDQHGDIAGYVVNLVGGDLTPPRAVAWIGDQAFLINGLGFAQGVASGINDYDQVVGTLSNSEYPPLAGFLWQSGQDVNLNTLVAGSGWQITSAGAINDVGQILASGRFRGGPAVAVLLVPRHGGHQQVSDLLSADGGGQARAWLGWALDQMQRDHHQATAGSATASM